MTDTLRWGILGTGRIAAALANGIKASKSAKLVAVGSRSQANANSFGDEHNAANRHDSYEGVIDDDEVDAVYVALPNYLHAPWAIRAAAAGKHVLCEKPLAMDADEAQTIIDAADRHDVFLMEAFMYRCHPLIAKLVELVREDSIGPLRMIQSTFSFRMDPDRVAADGDCRLVNAWGGGSILDVGCYCCSLTRLVAGAAAGLEFADPISVKGEAVFHKPDGPNKVDMAATASARFAGVAGRPEVVAALTCGMSTDARRDFIAYGETGWIHIEDPWFAHKCRKVTIQRTDAKKPETITLPDDGVDLYTTEVDTVAAHVTDRQVAPPGATWADSLSNMRMLDAWRASAGLTWQRETDASVAGD